MVILFLMGMTLTANDSKIDNSNCDKDPMVNDQDPITLPVGTILFLKSTKTISAKNFNAGDHFFVELDKDVTSKGKVLIPKGTIVQMDVLVSENNKRRASQFGVTVGGFIIDNYLQQVKTETKLVTTEDMAGGTVKKAAIGAGVGAAFDGGRGAGRGAAIGGAVGLLKPGQSIQFPAGTEAQFQLELPLKVDW
ncbi:MAG: hypothetical protein MUO53_01420 [Maribacter sp.]|nr:hypothetical protein [Maribacter sp.]